MRRYILIILLAVVSLSTTVNAQKSDVIKGGEICEDYLLKKIAQEKAADTQFVKINSPDESNQKLSPNLKKWLELADKQKIVSFEVRNKEEKATILGSSNIRATGLAANFQYWYIGLNNKTTEFISLSEKPELIFWDKTGVLNYYRVDYSDEFLKKQDWDNLRLDLLRFRINSFGESQLLKEERNVKCE